MFAYVLEFVPPFAKKEEFIKVMKDQILPILKTQAGFVDFLPFFPETKNEKMITVSLWTEKKHAEAYQREVFAKVQEILKPYLTMPIVYKPYVLETTLCEHFEKVLVA